MKREVESVDREAGLSEVKAEAKLSQRVGVEGEAHISSLRRGQGGDVWREGGREQGGREGRREGGREGRDEGMKL